MEEQVSIIVYGLPHETYNLFVRIFNVFGRNDYTVQATWGYEEGARELTALGAARVTFPVAFSPIICGLLGMQNTLQYARPDDHERIEKAFAQYLNYVQVRYHDVHGQH